MFFLKFWSCQNVITGDVWSTLNPSKCATVALRQHHYFHLFKYIPGWSRGRCQLGLHLQTRALAHWLAPPALSPTPGSSLTSDACGLAAPPPPMNQCVTFLISYSHWLLSETLSFYLNIIQNCFWIKSYFLKKYFWYRNKTTWSKAWRPVSSYTDLWQWCETD